MPGAFGIIRAAAELCANKNTALQSVGSALAPGASRVGDLLKQQGGTIACFEATTGGLINASLQAVPGASRYYRGGSNVYGTEGYDIYPAHLKDLLLEHRAKHGSGYETEREYWESKVAMTQLIASEMRLHVNVDWCIAESGATGPTFVPEDCNEGFTAIAICGPDDLQEVALVVSDHGDREKNMWQFTASAIEFMEEALEKSARNQVQNP
jgi:nicotinamide-nucleotide amidase